MKLWMSFFPSFFPFPYLSSPTVVDCIQPAPGETICDPACGTGGFLLAAHDYVAAHHQLDKDQKRHLRFDALRGIDIVDSVTRLCAMNLFLHGIGPSDDHSPAPLKTDDALRDEPTTHVEAVLTNPPFGKKSSITVVNAEGEEGSAARCVAARSADSR
jgi:type I restriction enzyme M protein